MKCFVLQTVFTNFTATMQKRLTEKESCGWKGWNNKDNYSDHEFKMRIVDKLLAPNSTKKDMVDIANYAMFLSERKY